ncbi:MAG TPA: biotin/lipoyl-containing protein, partial [Cryobacterium sp.]|nr:biotin/lipoyl-containing protein [Cryobacterium sp.]
ASGVLVTWFVDSGDPVTPSTLVAEVAMDKVDAEVYPDAAGTITLLAQEGEEIRQGQPIARVD